MDTEDIVMFGSAAERALEDLSPLAEMRDRSQVCDLLARKTWATAIELGWSGLCIPVEFGGYALGVGHLCALGMAVGRALAVGPFAANMALAPILPALGIADALTGALLPAIVSGEIVLTSSCSLGAPAPRAAPSSERSASPVDSVVLEHANVANRAVLIRLHPTGPTIRGEGSLVDLSVPGVLLGEAHCFDPTCRGRRISHGRSSVAANAASSFSFELPRAQLDQVLSPLRLFMAAQAVGIAQRALELAIAHVSTRRQFGRPLGAFQAVKHQLANVHIMNEKARVLTRSAADAAAAGCPEAYVDGHLAWIAATRAAIEASQRSLQLHGALGFAWEHPCHLFLKRAHTLAAGFVGVVDSRELVAEYVKTPANLRRPGAG